MYDEYKANYSKYRGLKGLLVDYINGDYSDKDTLLEKIEDAYNNGEISSNQYDNLMNDLIE